MAVGVLDGRNTVPGAPLTVWVPKTVAPLVEEKPACVWLAEPADWNVAAGFFLLAPTPQPTATAMTTSVTMAMIMIPFLVRKKGTLAGLLPRASTSGLAGGGAA